MPISKDGNGRINSTASENKTNSNITGVFQAKSFAVCDNQDQIKQIAFDPSAQATNSTVTIKSGAVAGNVTITLPATDTTLGAAASQTRITLATPNGAGSTNTNVLCYTTVVDNSGGADLTYTADTTNGDKIVVNTAGVYAVAAWNYNATAGAQFGITVNSTTLSGSSNISTIPSESQMIFLGNAAKAGGECYASRVRYFAANDIIRIQGDGGAITWPTSGPGGFNVQRIS